MKVRVTTIVTNKLIMMPKIRLTANPFTALAPNTLPASHPLAFADNGNIETVTQHAINAIAQDLRSNPKPTRQGVAKALANN